MWRYIKKRVDLTEQNQCDFWIQHIKIVIDQLKNLDNKFVVDQCNMLKAMKLISTSTGSLSLLLDQTKTNPTYNVPLTLFTKTCRSTSKENNAYKFRSPVLQTRPKSDILLRY